MPEDTATAIVDIGGMKDLIPEDGSKQELSLVKEEEIKEDLTQVTEKDDQKTEIPVIVAVGGIKELTPSVELASENLSDISSLDDTEYANKTESEESEIVESVDLDKKPEELGPDFSPDKTEELAIQLFHASVKPVTDDKVKLSSEVPAVKLSSEALVVKVPVEDSAVKVSSEPVVVEVSSEEPAIEASNESEA